jgi:putative N-acetylmannosamine-6-phosphate epimerase
MSNTITLNPYEQTTRKIISLLDQLIHDYHQIQQSEALSLIEVLPLNEQEFSIMEEIDLITTDLRGYASQIKNSNQIQKPEQALKYLRQTLILNNPLIADLYFSQKDKFPLTHQYLQKLDYLKFLLIDALTNNSDR